MTILSEIARDLGDIVDAAGNDRERMTENQLTVSMRGLGIASAQCSQFLVRRLRDDVERARVEISRAMDLPSRVLRRRADETASVNNRGELPNIPQQAAWIAMILCEIQSIGARIERIQSGSAIN